MKKIIIFILIAFILVSSIELLENDNMEDITITTSVYPIHYIVKYLYKDHSVIENMYPDEIDFNNYILSDKQITDFSRSRLLIFNGLGKEQNYALEMIKKNKDLLIIDAALGMELENTIEETWFNLNNFLMLAINIKKGLNEYIVSPVLNEEINKNYNDLKIKISTLEASFYQLKEEAPNNVIVTNHKMFEFLEKYGFKVITLDNTIKETDKKLEDVKNLIENNTIKTIFIKDNSELSPIVKQIIKDFPITTTSINSLSTITSQEKENNEDYFSIMENNLNLIKSSLYN